MLTMDIPLPVEVLGQVIGYLSTYEIRRFCLARVSSKWRAAVNCSRQLQVTATEALALANLANVVDAHICLDVLHLERQFSFSASNTNDQLVHQIASQFTGHPTLTVIISDSEHILPGAINCPQLQVLQLNNRFTHTSTNVNLHAQSRNIAFILRHTPMLHTLHINNPTLWTREPFQPYQILLHTLVVHDISAWTLMSLTQFMSHSSLPHLQHLEIEADLHLPSTFIEVLKTYCPKLITLRLESFTLAPSHIYELMMTPHLPLTTLCMRYCNLMFQIKQQHMNSTHSTRDTLLDTDVGVYMRLTRYLTYFLPTLVDLTFKHCGITHINIASVTEYRWFHTTSIESTLYDAIALNLRRLSIEYVGRPRFTKIELQELFQWCPNLQELKMHTSAVDLTSDQLLNMDESNEVVILPRLQHLELRYSSVFTTERELSPDIQISNENDKEVDNKSLMITPSWTTFSCYAPPPTNAFIQSTLYPVQNHLTQLNLNYPHLMFADRLSLIDSVNSISLPALQRLSIRTIGSHSGLTALSLLTLLTRHARQLEHIHIEALHSSLHYLPPPAIHSLVMNAPRVQRALFYGFRITPPILSYIANWGYRSISPGSPMLKSLKLLGLRAITIDACMHIALHELLSNSRHLRQLSLSVDTISVPIINARDSSNGGDETFSCIDNSSTVTMFGWPLHVTDSGVDLSHGSFNDSDEQSSVPNDLYKRTRCIEYTHALQVRYPWLEKVEVWPKLSSPAQDKQGQE